MNACTDCGKPTKYPRDTHCGGCYARQNAGPQLLAIPTTTDIPALLALAARMGVRVWRTAPGEVPQPVTTHTAQESHR
ncbi:hypothetical protein N866_01800 [Actinotalea ferrariae CF5-4]|uniref:Uncharacterized protein n=1 Tax=Actinotalea ferrariae CF5-4 TaxID=948458 RepID=A0A021VW10_9CELL|nr:hypothetical protein [Actinotalea ferrariae]EYR63272.1 hypothetical protein N866_01800 [Actinotalea ferrariae CF5-4]